MNKNINITMVTTNNEIKNIVIPMPINDSILMFNEHFINALQHGIMYRVAQQLYNHSKVENFIMTVTTGENHVYGYVFTESNTDYNTCYSVVDNDFFEMLADFGLNEELEDELYEICSSYKYSSRDFIFNRIRENL